jgi:DNA repair photolyase
MSHTGYRYFLSLSSQFPFCGIPLRLDSFSRCQFACRYCFASARGGAGGQARIQTADPKRLARRLMRLETSRQPGSVLDELLLARIPIHFGGMSDPFMPLELDSRITLDLLQILAEHRYPTLISTKGSLVDRDEYVSLLARPNFAVQFSLTTLSDELSARIDVGTPATSVRLQTLRTLTAAGVKTAVRHQPVLPTRTAEAAELIAISAEYGAGHYSLEHLKLPVEVGWQHRDSLSDAVGFDLANYYADRHAIRVGREWILPIGERLDEVMRLKAIANSCGLSFGAADNDLLHLSDGSVCCSGADLLGIGKGLQFNFLSAVRTGLIGNPITFQSIAHEWRPTRPIAEYVNSRSRQPNESFDSFIRSRWNGVQNGPSPQAFHGVLDTGDVDREGMKIYLVQDDVRLLSG